jgi:hypothetical protein
MIPRSEDAIAMYPHGTAMMSSLSSSSSSCPPVADAVINGANDDDDDIVIVDDDIPRGYRASTSSPRFTCVPSTFAPGRYSPMRHSIWIAEEDLHAVLDNERRLPKLRKMLRLCECGFVCLQELQLERARTIDRGNGGDKGGIVERIATTTTTPRRGRQEESEGVRIRQRRRRGIGFWEGIRPARVDMVPRALRWDERGNIIVP